PTSSFASDDLPAPLGPTTPSIRPPCSENDTSARTTDSLPGGVNTTRETTSDPSGRGRVMRFSAPLALPRTRFSRSVAIRNDQIARQLDVTDATGPTTRMAM